jgi:ATP-dependent DNA helicase RecG-like protein
LPLLRLAGLGRDGQILQNARALAQRILDKYPELQHPLNAPLWEYMEQMGRKGKSWGLIS